MKLTFHLPYNTTWGELPYLTVKSDKAPQAVAMTPVEESAGVWQATLEVAPAESFIDYSFEIRTDSGEVRREWGGSRRLRLDSHLTEAIIEDRWHDAPEMRPFFTEPFTGCVFRPEAKEHFHSLRPAVLQFRLTAPMIEPHQAVAVAGNCEALGNWDPAKAPLMEPEEMPQWSLQIPLQELPERLEYKFVIVNRADRSEVAWENSDNRSFTLPELPSGASVVLSGLYLENPLPLWRGAGTAIPVFSLRSERSFGVGDFADLRMMIDWCALTGQKFLQLLPINDTTMTRRWTDSYPYTTNSTFALHPMYLRLDEVGQLSDAKLQSEFDREAKRLQLLPTVDYEAVNNAKERYMRLIFKQQGKAEMTSESFTEFARCNDFWLLPYAAWSVLRDRYNTPDMSQWGPYAVYNEEAISRFIEENRDDIDFYRFEQYHLDRQMRRARDYGHSRGVALKGDIPIGISRCSVDAWLHPELFNLDSTAGAPPDDFARLGQNWGFPTYRWDVMRGDNYAWWRQRLTKMADYFDAYRIDHVLGFFRIWQIPARQLHGLLGVFCPALPYSPEELADDYGFHLTPSLMCRPNITDAMLTERLGSLADRAKEYLTRLPSGLYRLRKPFESQVELSWHFAGLPKTDENDLLCRTLCDLIDEVLFIEDPYKAGHYHPRIDGFRTALYATLSEDDRKAYDRLYHEFFYERHNDFWKREAMSKLPELTGSTAMLACAEDLGMIPACVPQVMDELRILSLEIQRMPKEPWVAFGYPSRYPYLSVCSTSTHDMSGIRSWWKDMSAESRDDFYHRMLELWGDTPAEATPELCRAILAQNLGAPSMLCILPLQDWMSVDGQLRRPNPDEEQINVPACPRHYWRYRMHLTLDELMKADGFNQAVRDMIGQSGRH